MKRFWRTALPLGAALCLIPATPAEEPDKAEGSPARRLRVFDGQHVGPGTEGLVYNMVFYGDGKTLVSAGTDRTVRWWDFATGKEVRRLKGRFEAGRIALSPDGKRLATAAAHDKEYFGVCVWDATSGKLLYRVAEGHNRWPIVVAFSPDGTRLASGGEEGDILIRETETGKLRQRLKSDSGGGRGLGFSPDGRLLFAAYDRNFLCCWDLVLGKRLWEAEQFRPMALSPDADLIAAVGGEGCVVSRALGSTSPSPVPSAPSSSYRGLFPPSTLRPSSSASVPTGGRLSWPANTIRSGVGTSPPVVASRPLPRGRSGRTR